MTEQNRTAITERQSGAIIKRLQNLANALHGYDAAACLDAVAEIERLRSVIPLAGDLFERFIESGCAEAEDEDLLNALSEWFEVDR